jgi:hypothetical protein
MPPSVFLQCQPSVVVSDQIEFPLPPLTFLGYLIYKFKVYLKVICLGNGFWQTVYEKCMPVKKTAKKQPQG